MSHEEPFEHTIQPWTVGDLRRAIEGVPDETRIKVNVAETPGGDTCDEQVLYEAGFGRYRMGDDPPDTWRTDAVFGLDCDFPPGTYYRTVDEED